MRQGTSFRESRIVRGTCESCGDADALLYDHWSDEQLVCAGCQRVRVIAHPTKQACDNCGATGNVWRDPIPRKNEYLCAKCHDPEAMFQNRWANSVREGAVLNFHDKAVCAAKGYGTDCKGEIKPRGGKHRGMLLCNKHAGKTSSGPEWHQ